MKIESLPAVNDRCVTIGTMPKESNHATLKTTMKKCTVCHQAKPLDQFYKDKERKDGLAHRCKVTYNRFGQRIICQRAIIKRLVIEF